jgi:hypothetical protein
MAYDRQTARAQAEASRQELIRQWDEEGQARGTASPPLRGDDYATVKAARDEWERSAAIRAEFTCLESFIAFRKAEARGAVRIISRKT